MAQAVVLQSIDDVQYRDYAIGQVVDFPADILDWLKFHRKVTDSAGAVAAAIAGGAVQLVHSAGSAPSSSVVADELAKLPAALAAVRGAAGGARAGYLGIAAVGDSRRASITTDGLKINTSRFDWLNRALMLSGRPGRLVYHGAVGGRRTDQFAADVAAAAAHPAVTDVFLKGGINNISVGANYNHAITGAVVTPAQSGVAAANDMIGYIKTFVAAGKRVWVEEEEGADSTWPGTPWNAAWTTQAGIFNAVLSAYCRNNPVGVVFITWPKFFDKSVAGNKHIALLKYDGTHDSTGGSLLRAQDFLARYNPWPQVRPSFTTPGQLTYSGDPANPIQLLDNPGFTTRTGGTLNAGSAVLTAWGAGAVAAKSFRTNGGNLYYTVAGGVAAAAAPTHTAGTVADGGGVQWTYIMSVATGNTLPAGWYTAAGGGGTYAVGTVINSDNSVEVVLISFFSAANSNVQIIQDMATNRQVVGGLYSLQAVAQTDDHVNLGSVDVGWTRGDMTNPPTDGVGGTNVWTDTQGNFTGAVGTYPIVETLQTVPFTCESQNTPGAVATWNGFRLRVIGAGAGFAITRFRECQMLRVS